MATLFLGSSPSLEQCAEKGVTKVRSQLALRTPVRETRVHAGLPSLHDGAATAAWPSAASVHPQLRRRIQAARRATAEGGGERLRTGHHVCGKLIAGDGDNALEVGVGQPHQRRERLDAREKQN